MRGSSGVASWKIICKPEPREEVKSEEEETVEDNGREDAGGLESTGDAEEPAASANLGLLSERLAGDSVDDQESWLEGGEAADLVGGWGEDQGGGGAGELADDVASGRGGGADGGGSSSPAVLEVTEVEEEDP